MARAELGLPEREPRPSRRLPAHAGQTSDHSLITGAGRTPPPSTFPSRHNSAVGAPSTSRSRGSAVAGPLAGTSRSWQHNLRTGNARALHRRVQLSRRSLHRNKEADRGPRPSDCRRDSGPTPRWAAQRCTRRSFPDRTGLLRASPPGIRPQVPGTEPRLATTSPTANTPMRIRESLRRPPRRIATCRRPSRVLARRRSRWSRETVSNDSGN